MRGEITITISSLQAFSSLDPCSPSMFSSAWLNPNTRLSLPILSFGMKLSFFKSRAGGFRRNLDLAVFFFFVQGFDLCVWLMPLLIIKCCHFPLATKTKLNCVSPLYKFVEHFARYSPRKACLKKWGDGQRCNIHLIPNGLRVEKQKSWIFTMG